jgi:hypothetical protein
VLLAACLLVIVIVVFLIMRVKPEAALTFYIPAVTFFIYTLGTAIMGGTRYYFLTYLVICGIGAIYSYYTFFRNFIILSHAVILLFIAARIPLLNSDPFLKDILADWIIAAYTTIFFLMLSRFLTEKSSRVRTGRGYLQSPNGRHP